MVIGQYEWERIKRATEAAVRVKEILDQCSGIDPQIRADSRRLAEGLLEFERKYYHGRSH